MQIKQFEDKPLSHYSYAVMDEGTRNMVLIDPSRDPGPYIAHAEALQSSITAVIETHPHADFVSSHLELYHLLGATVYCSRITAAQYPHQGFNSGDEIVLGTTVLKAIDTPGHSPDSICVLAFENSNQKALFTGDTLFIGDCGRPDLRENSGEAFSKKEALAKQMYYSLREGLSEVVSAANIFPAHGAGSLCGKALSDLSSSTMGEERSSNWALQSMSEEAFVASLLEDQPFVPAYFPFDVALNRKGALEINPAVSRIASREPALFDGLSERLKKSMLIDTRPADQFSQKHIKDSINLMEKGKFETWLGSLIEPGEFFSIAAESDEKLREVLFRTAKIGYETFVDQAFVIDSTSDEGWVSGALPSLDVPYFREHLDQFTIVDIRNENEVKAHRIFEAALPIPFPQLRNRYLEIPIEKPIVVHCAGGYRSAAGSSILRSLFPENVVIYDLGPAIDRFI